MNLTKNLTLLAAAAAISTPQVSAQFASFDFQSSSFGNYRQYMPNGGAEFTYFEAGAFAIDVFDGNAVFSPPGCVSPLFFSPSPGCPIGATGYVIFGDLNGDGVNDAGTYYSITEIAAAAILQPFAANDATLISAPPSLLPRPLSGFVDDSRTIYYNLFSSLIQKYDNTILELDRFYTSAERNTFDRELVPGTYRFNFKALINPFATVDSPPVSLELNLFPALDGFRKINNVKQGFRFKNAIYQDGFALLDPLELNTLEWEGNTVAYIAPAADLLHLSIKPLVDPTDPTSDAVTYDGAGQYSSNPAFDDPPSGLEAPNTVVDGDLDPEFIINPTLPLFPTFAGPTVTRVYVPNPLVQEYILPPNFIAFGQTGVIDVEFTLNRPTTAVIADRSVRRFRLPVRIVTIFRTAIASKLPATATELQKSADYDYDGDGSSNFAEWAFGSDPADASSNPSFANAVVAKAVEPTTPISTRDGSTETSGNGLKFEISKLVNPIPALTYTIEFSSDMNNWETVTSADPRFTVSETESKLSVSTVGAPEGGGFFRSKVVEK
ncbi:MAG: hypothetical protein ACSHX9_09365 [Luteolibacter sp.]